MKLKLAPGPKIALTLALLSFSTWVVPTGTIDPWHVFSPKRMLEMTLALASIQAIGAVAIHLLGSRASAMVTGFLGGLISSTATTATLSRNSARAIGGDGTTGTIIFLCATLAMLLEAAAITALGVDQFNLSFLLVFAGPMICTTAMLLVESRKAVKEPSQPNEIFFEIFPLIKLTFFVVGVLTLSTLLQRFLGKVGLLTLTFVASLFEVHGSVIANIQLYDAGSIGVGLLDGLLATSVTASCLSKLFLVATLGSDRLKGKVVKFTGVLLLSIAASAWAALIVS